MAFIVEHLNFKNRIVLCYGDYVTIKNCPSKLTGISGFKSPLKNK